MGIQVRCPGPQHGIALHPICTSAVLAEVCLRVHDRDQLPAIVFPARIAKTCCRATEHCDGRHAVQSCETTPSECGHRDACPRNVVHQSRLLHPHSVQHRRSVPLCCAAVGHHDGNAGQSRCFSKERQTGYW